VTTKWWPAWKDQHPSSEYGTRKKVEKRILPTFGDIPLGELDPSTIGKWKAAMVAEGLTARTVNTYLALLGTILNAAVDDDYLARSPLLRKSGAGRTAATRNQPVPRREVWLLREQLDQLVEAIDPRYRALVLVAALTGMRWGELAALRWDDPRLDQPLDDGAVRGPGRLRRARAISDPRRTGHGVEKGPKTEAGKRVIALDQETVQAFLAHRELVGGGPYDRIFTSPGGSRGPAGTLVHRNFIRVWKRALVKAELAHLWPEYGGLHFHDLRHTHATWLIAQRVPMIAVAAWMVDHDTDAYYKIASAFVDGRPSGNLTRDHILDNITLYWLTGSGASTSRSYWEAYGPDAPAAGQQPLPPTTIPFAFTTFPGEIWRTPRSWVEASYPNVTYFHEVDKGGHFAAWEEPELFSTDLRAAFRSLR
jgi:integrase